MSGRTDTDNADKEYLHRQLVKLGDMLGDGDCDAWVGQEYNRIARQLGYMPQKASKRRLKIPERVKAEINGHMEIRCQQEQCPECKRHSLKQSRSGSMSASCTLCGRSFKLLRRAKK